MNKFYVYSHLRKDTGEVFYIGKGFGKRSESRSGRNKWWKNIVEKHGFTTQILADRLSEQEAFNFEILMIRKLREENVQLVNQTDGGEGTSGLNFSETHRIRIGITSRLKCGPKNGMYGRTGEKAPMYGRTGEKAPMYGRTGKKNPMYGRTGEKHPMFGRGDLISGEKHPMYGRTGEKNPMYGKTFKHTEESRAKISLARKEYHRKKRELTASSVSPLKG